MNLDNANFQRYF